MGFGESGEWRESNGAGDGVNLPSPFVGFGLGDCAGQSGGEDGEINEIHVVHGIEGLHSRDGWCELDDVTSVVSLITYPEANEASQLCSLAHSKQLQVATRRSFLISRITAASQCVRSSLRSPSLLCQAMTQLPKLR